VALLLARQRRAARTIWDTAEGIGRALWRRQVHDLPRVLRLPGFIHQKGKPFLSVLQAVDKQRPPYTLKQMLEAFPPPAAPVFVPAEPVSAFRLNAWGEAALDGMAQDLAAAPEGSRNNTANELAFRAGRMVAGGLFSQGEAYRRLEAAALSLGGIRPCDRVLGASGTIARGIRDGMTKGPAITGPRDIRRALSRARSSTSTPWPPSKRSARRPVRHHPRRTRAL
jgi:hypothetical protein